MKIGSLHPQTLFNSMAKTLNAQIQDGRDNTRFFEFKKTAATPEFIKAANYISQKTGMNCIDCPTSIATVTCVSKIGGNACLIIQTRHYKKIFKNENTTSFSEDLCCERDNLGIRYHIYDQGKAWNYTSAKTSFPCSMKDFFYYQNQENVESDIFHALFLAWGARCLFGETWQTISAQEVPTLLFRLILFFPATIAANL